MRRSSIALAAGLAAALLLAPGCTRSPTDLSQPLQPEAFSSGQTRPQEDWPAFTGRVVLDESVPRGTKLPRVSIFGEEPDGLHSWQAATLTPDGDGIFTAERPAELLSVHVHTDQLPDGVGVVLEGTERHFALKDLSGEFVLSAVASAEIFMEPTDMAPGVRLCSAAGQELYVWNWDHDLRGRWLDEETGLVEISGLVKLGESVSFPVSCTVDVSGLTQEERGERLDYWGVTGGVGFDGYAANGAYCGP